jgi:hypothetical protein
MAEYTFEDDDNEDVDGFIQSGLRDIFREQIAANKDHGTKEVGDVVLVWDSSRLTLVDNDEIVVNPVIHTLVSKNESIVIETGCRYNGDRIIGDRVYPKNLDLVIWCKKLNKKYRTSSDFVKRTNL